MANQPIPVVLDQGLDTVTPPIAAKPGSLYDCLNYEMVGDVGYRRIDGYERYNGNIGGEITEYYSVTLTISDAAIESALTVGSYIYTTDIGSTVGVIAGVVLAYNPTTKVLTYAPANNEAPLIVSGAKVDVSSTGSRATAAATAARGSVTNDATTFLSTLRSYQTALRNRISGLFGGSPIAGMHWFRNTLLVAVDAQVLTVTLSSSDAAQVKAGSRLTIGGVGTVEVLATSYTGGVLTASVSGIYSGATPTGTLTVGGITGAFTSLAASNLSLSNASADWATMYHLYAPDTGGAAAPHALYKVIRLSYTGGVAGAESYFKKGASLSLGPDGSNFVNMFVVDHVLESGTFAGNNAAGSLYVILTPNDGFPAQAGTVGPITSAMDIFYVPTASLIKGADIASVDYPKIAGTKRLRMFGSRYQWKSHNFYGQSDTMEAYGATGASRAVYAKAFVPKATVLAPPGATAVGDPYTYFYYGNLYTNPIEVLDNPKFVSIHAGTRLALALGSGAVFLSVSGSPRNWAGVAGAQEIDTGDDVTGMVAGPEDSTIIFGIRTIRRITGNSASTYSSKVIIPNAGAYPYSVASVFGDIVFAGPSGISTIQQAMEYGDFVGKRVSERVSTTLVPKLVTDWSDSEPGGVICAMPCRTKDQYRLFLGNGEVFTVTKKSDGYAVLRSNYGSDADVRVPFAWTSELSDSGKERMFVAWDSVYASKNVAVSGLVGTIPDQSTIYEIDRGWGFDGKTFTHYIDLSHTFVNNGANFIGIEGIRVHGMSHGLATLDVKASGIEEDYDQPYHNTVQDVSMPEKYTRFSQTMRPVTTYIDHANWGLGIKLRIQGSLAAGLTNTEPSHICQVLLLQLRTEGANDNG